MKTDINLKSEIILAMKVSLKSLRSSLFNHKQNRSFCFGCLEKQHTFSISSGRSNFDLYYWNSTK